MRLYFVLTMSLFAGVAVLIAAVYLSGALTKEGLRKLLDVEPAAVVETVEPASEAQISEVVKALNERELELNDREAALKTEAARVEATRVQLEELRTVLRDLVADATQSLDEADSDRQERLQNVALSLGAMKAQQAAEAIGAWAPEDAAVVLQMIEERARGKILDNLSPDEAAAILRAMENVSLVEAPAETPE
ncbi:MAG: hypothetical protein SGI88_16850 [Candidatus Hydrogenedentes bacterium]|nr:hypothetical protein [Candidatus Hydrogenedentota bacterium]